ncbi:MAG: ester cyclase [Anaerolineae bacterium]|nr:ester cyclase [Anaerolineae bacterium]
MDVWEYEGDKVKRSTTYLDLAGMLVQLGVMPAPQLPELKPSFELPAPEPTGLAPLEAGTEAMDRWNTHDLAGLAKVMAPGADVFISTLGVPMDRDAFIASQELYFQAFPDIKVVPVRQVDLGGGWVLAEVIYKGTNTGPLFGIPATGKSFAIRAGWIAHYDEGGLETYLHVYLDNLTLLQQLGLAPAGEGRQ